MREDTEEAGRAYLSEDFVSRGGLAGAKAGIHSIRSQQAFQLGGKQYRVKIRTLSQKRKECGTRKFEFREISRVQTQTTRQLPRTGLLDN